MKTFEKYQANLHQKDNKIISYSTHIATIKDGYLMREKWEIKRVWKGIEETITSSPTTTKHLNYVASELNLKIK